MYPFSITHFSAYETDVMSTDVAGTYETFQCISLLNMVKVGDPPLVETCTAEEPTMLQGSEVPQLTLKLHLNCQFLIVRNNKRGTFEASLSLQSLS
jgi:hypothetical protein